MTTSGEKISRLSRSFVTHFRNAFNRIIKRSHVKQNPIGNRAVLWVGFPGFFSGIDRVIEIGRSDYSLAKFSFPSRHAHTHTHTHTTSSPEFPSKGLGETGAVKSKNFRALFAEALTQFRTMRRKKSRKQKKEPRRLLEISINMHGVNYLETSALHENAICVKGPITGAWRGNKFRLRRERYLSGSGKAPPVPVRGPPRIQFEGARPLRPSNGNPGGGGGGTSPRMHSIPDRSNFGSFPGVT